MLWLGFGCWSQDQQRHCWGNTNEGRGKFYEPGDADFGFLKHIGDIL